MRIAYLRVGAVPEPLRTQFDDYYIMFQQLFARHAAEITLHNFAVRQGEFPTDRAAFDGYLIGGSADSAYDPAPWIAPLERFIQSLHREQRPLVGICFGHQIIAQALGGVVMKAASGWGLGIRPLTCQQAVEQPAGLPTVLNLHYSHQDQVTTPPEAATTVASAAHCPHAALSIGKHILTFQGHPEFNSDYCGALIRSRKGRIAPDAVDEALETLEQSADNGLIARWIADFYMAAKGQAC
uniref:Glutamine amidotransferase domain-containing protein n=1 Tax=Magnetococcus massalia (strain MO-1) TaxID=451514 RepID=A0A1S7LM84_MAGMO|nr:Conserved protein of unknown function. Putative glutamine amidotransferase [Candidatus Magnetococcus massalia]